MVQIADVFPGLGAWMNQNRMQSRQGSTDAAMNLLGEQHQLMQGGDPQAGLDQLSGAGDVMGGGYGLMADMNDPGAQMRYATGLMQIPGYEQAGRNYGAQAFSNQLGMPMQQMKARQDQANWQQNQQRQQITSAMRNITAAGYKPGTPEYQSAMGQYLMKTDTTTINLPGQAELRMAGFAAQTIRSGNEINAMEDSGYIPSFADMTAARLPMGIGNAAVSPEYQKRQALATDWIYGVLRPESGAVINADELDQHMLTYFTQPGDTAETIALKRRLRAQKEQIRIQGAGTAEIKVLEAAGAGEGTAAVEKHAIPPAPVGFE